MVKTISITKLSDYSHEYSITATELDDREIIDARQALEQSLFSIGKPLATEISVGVEQIRYALQNCPELFSGKIPAIKFVRALTGMGLKESKDFVESCSIVYREQATSFNQW